MTITLPLPPSTNNLYATVRGRRVLSAKATQYKRDVGMIILQSSHRLRLHERRYSDQDPFRLTAHIYFKTPRKRDLDGAIKILQDAIFEALGRDDRCVDELHIYRCIDKEQPRAVVSVEAIQQPPFVAVYVE